MKGKLVVLSGPSGVGKSTAIAALMQKNKDFYFSISATTRSKRPGEKDGVSYHFLSREQFHKMIAQNQLLEYAEYVGNFYGTPLAPIEQALREGRDALLDIDVQGALQIKKRCSDAILVFLVTPSFSELERRLRGRGDTAPDLIEKRLEKARWEYSQAGSYDYIVLSDKIEHVTQEILAILTAEKCRAENRISLLKEEP